MAYGGGTWTVQNKILPGSYINFISVGTANIFNERGAGAAISSNLKYIKALEMELTKEEFYNNCKKYFNVKATDYSLWWIREFFTKGKSLIIVPITENTGYKRFALYNGNTVIAKLSGYYSYSPDIEILVKANIDDESKFDFIVKVDNEIITELIGISELNSKLNNDCIEFTKKTELSADSKFTANNEKDSSGGAVSYDIDITDALSRLEKYAYNTLFFTDNITDTNAKYLINWVKTMRDDYGKKFQAVISRSDELSPNYEGIISVAENSFDIEDNAGTIREDYANMIPWVAGATAGAEVNESLSNMIYDGEFILIAEYSQLELEKFIQKGVFAFHKCGDDYRVLKDINSLVDYTNEKNELFSSNQTIRVIDQIAIDIAEIFNTRYIGKVSNDQSGRVSLWNDIVTHHKKLETLRAIENFDSEDVTVEKGETKTSVVVTDKITPVNAMEQLYMTVIIE